VNAVTNLRVPKNVGNSLISSEQVSLSRTVLHAVSKGAVGRTLFAILNLSCSGRLED
jgi:hypothetical protein